MLNILNKKKKKKNFFFSLYYQLYNNLTFIDTEYYS